MSPVCSGKGKQVGRLPLAGLLDCIYMCCTVLVLVSQLESAASDSSRLERTQTEAAPPPSGPGLGVWLRGWVGPGPRAEGATNGKTGNYDICALSFCLAVEEM